MNRHPTPILIVTVSVAAVALIFVLSVAYCAIAKVEPNAAVMETLKSAGLVALGSLVSFLTSVRTQSEPPKEPEAQLPPIEPDDEQ